MGLIPGSGICPREGNGKPLQYSCLIYPWIEDPGRWQFTLLISFRIDWFDLAVQGFARVFPSTTVKNINSLALSLLYGPTLPYITTGKTIALTIQTFVSKMMSLLFDMLSRLVIAFLSRSKSLLISWLQSLSALIMEAKKKNNEVCHCFHCFPIYLPWSDGTGCHGLCYLNAKF